MTETVSDLLPCPFCGGVDLRLTTSTVDAMSWVTCRSCGLEAPSETGVDDAQAVAYWNRRTPPQNTDGEAVAWIKPEWLERLKDGDVLQEGCLWSRQNGGGTLVGLVPASALSAMKAEMDAAERTRELMAADWLQFCETMGVQFDTHEAVASDLLRRLSAIEAERDALLADSTDKAQAWDAIAEKNATIAALKSDLTRYIDIANAEANEAESLRAQVALHRKDSSDYLDALVRERARAEKAEAERDALAKALRPFSIAVFNDNGDVTIDTSHITQREWLAARSTLQGDAK